MEATDGAAGDGDEAEGEDAAGEDGSGAIDEAGEGGHLHLGLDDEDSDGEQNDDAKLDESAEVVAGGEEEPDGQGAGGKAVENDTPGEADGGDGEDGGPSGRVGDPLATEDGGDNEQEANKRNFENAARAV